MKSYGKQLSNNEFLNIFSIVLALLIISLFIGLLVWGNIEVWSAIFS
jgi:hypothetical protein